MSTWFFKTCPSNVGALILRIALGVMMLPHGLQKTLGLFGGNGFSATLEGLTGNGIPWVIALLVIVGESVGALSLILGFCTRFCAASLGVIMLGAIGLVHNASFFASSGGFEWHLVYVAGCLTLVLQGGGALSVDSLLGRCCDGACKGNCAPKA
jgi:putative oxidoreductase